jgi:nucleoside-diphosphate-sugar epimerase
MRIMIIGGTGLIDTPIARTLTERGHPVTLCIRSLTAARFANHTRRMIGDRRSYATFKQHNDRRRAL